MAARRRTRSSGIVQLRQELAAERYLPCYLLVGEDVVRTQIIVRYIVEHVLGEAGQAFNYHVFDGDDAGVDHVLQQALSFPMMSSRQVLWVKRAEQLCRGIEDEEALEKYLKQPSPETILIISADKVDGRKRWLKSAKSAGYFFEMVPPQGEELERWLRKAARERGFKLDRETMSLLIDQTGEDLISMGHELDKIAVIVLDEGRLPDPQQLRTLILEQRTVDPFEFLAQLGPDRAAGGLILLHRFLAEGHSAYELTPLIIWKIKQSAQVATLLEDGLDERTIAAMLGASPYAIKQAAGVVKIWGTRRVEKALLAVAKADRLLKGSSMDPAAVLESVILDICA